MSRTIKTTVSLEIFSWNELEDDIKDLIGKAKASADRAYAPYSNFMVGAALLLENGEIFTGNNQENVSFPAGICAERVAVSYAQANFPDISPSKIAIIAKSRDTVFANVTPCGLCRQTICEYERKFNRPIEIYMLNNQAEILKASGTRDLLPFSFSSLGENRPV